MSPNNYSALFEDAESSGFGCVLFDVEEGPDGKRRPIPGKGWSSKNGDAAKLIYSPNELDNDVYWFTNLDRNSLWQSSSGPKRKMKEASFLRTDMSQIMKETGLMPNSVSTAMACQGLSELFARVMSLASEHYSIKTFESALLIDDLRPKLLADDQEMGEPFDQALMRCFTDYIVCPAAPKTAQEILVTLRRPRFLHAQQVLDTVQPYGEWNVVLPEEFPVPDRLEWLLSKNCPGLVRVIIKKFNGNCPPWMPPLIQMGEALIENNRKKERDWLTLQEAKAFSRYAVIEIKAAVLCSGWQEVQALKPLCELGPLSHMSYSLGLLSECHWIAMSGRYRDSLNKQKIKVSPRSCYQRAADRFYCFSSASILAAGGFKVLSYGLGAVSIACERSRVAELIEIAPTASLTVPGYLYDKKDGI